MVENAGNSWNLYRRSEKVLNSERGPVGYVTQELLVARHDDANKLSGHRCHKPGWSLTKSPKKLCELDMLKKWDMEGVLLASCYSFWVAMDDMNFTNWIEIFPYLTMTWWLWCPHLSVGKNRKFFLYVAEVRRRVEMRGSSGLQRFFFPAIATSIDRRIYIDVHDLLYFSHIFPHFPIMLHRFSSCSHHFPIKNPQLPIMAMACCSSIEFFPGITKLRYQKNHGETTFCDRKCV